MESEYGEYTVSMSTMDIESAYSISTYMSIGVDQKFLVFSVSILTLPVSNEKIQTEASSCAVLFSKKPSLLTSTEKRNFSQY